MNIFSKFLRLLFADFSPERSVRLADYNGGQLASDGASECGSETSSECPEELYNLTKLAEVSLAAAAGTLIHHSNVAYQRRSASPLLAQYPAQASRSPAARSNVQQAAAGHQQQEQLPVQERTRLFFERIETERSEILAGHVEESSGVARRSSSRYPISCPPQEEPSIAKTPGMVPGDVEPSPMSVAASQAGRRMPINAESLKPEDSEDHECPDCGKKYSTSSNLARHRQTHRSLGDKKARRCPHCDKVYVSMPAFSMHVRTHNQGCKCHYCGKCFSRPWLLQGHIRTHTGNVSLDQHLRERCSTYSPTRAHVCSFSNNFNLNFSYYIVTRAFRDFYKNACKREKRLERGSVTYVIII